MHAKDTRVPERLLGFNGIPTRTNELSYNTINMLYFVIALCTLL